MRIRIGKTVSDLRPFLWTGFVWALVNVGTLVAAGRTSAFAFGTWALFFSLAVMDLFFLVKTIAAVVVLMSDQGAENRTAYALQAITYGSLKLLCLGAIGVFLSKFSNAPSLGILLGLSALMVVPLGGGFWWSQKQLKAEPDGVAG
ncbi:MAG: hypothetical protein H7301_00760 [Cryobacterium sp.]|nr:hypothetical protein [Oligoflexia bacterium]